VERNNNSANPERVECIMSYADTDIQGATPLVTHILAFQAIIRQYIHGANVLKNVIIMF
jgi:hypothetical protein